MVTERAGERAVVTGLLDGPEQLLFTGFWHVKSMSRRKSLEGNLKLFSSFLFHNGNREIPE